MRSDSGATHYSGLVACLSYGGLKLLGANDKTILSLSKGLEISTTLEVFVSFLLGIFIKKTIDIW